MFLKYTFVVVCVSEILKNQREHTRNVKMLIDAVEYHGGDLFYDKKIAEYEYNRDKEKGFKTKTLAYNPKGVTNNNESRTIGCIVLHPLGNLQGGW